MAAAGLAERYVVGRCYSFEALDSPISWIGFHFIKDLISLRHTINDTTGDTISQDVDSPIK